MAKNDLHSALPVGTVPLLAELVATALLLLVGCMGCTHHSDVGAPSLLQIVLAFGIVVMFNVQIFGHVSGAHMNPAVTLAAVLLKKMSPLLGLFYVLAQCLGALSGFGILLLMLPQSQDKTGFCVTSIHADVTPLQGLMVEVSITLVLILITCSFWDPVNKEKTDSLSIKFGLTITGLSLAGGHFTGASMNPARSLAPAVWTNSWVHHWVYWTGPLLGAVIASFLYKLLFQTRPASLAADPAEELPLSTQEKGAGGAA